MAMYHCSVKIIGRSSGRSSVGSAAYRSGDKLYNNHDGVSHDYTNKKDVVYSDIFLCDNAPIEYKDRSVLWNAVERIEKSSKSQLAREIEIALPVELNFEEQKELVRTYVNDNFISRGMCADVNIHDSGKGNPHAHIMLTMRAIDKEGEFMSKAKKIYALDENGYRIYNKKTRQYKSTRENTTNWDNRDNIEVWREDLADKINYLLKKKNILEKVDHRSFERQGIDRLPSIHLGSGACALEKRGMQTDRGNHNRQVKEYNKEIDGIDSRIDRVQREIKQTEKMIKPKTQDAKKVSDILYKKQKDIIDDFLHNKELDKQITLKMLYIKEYSKDIEEVKEDFIKLNNLTKSRDKNIKVYQSLKAEHRYIFNNTKLKQESILEKIKEQSSAILELKDSFKKRHKISPEKKSCDNKIKRILREIKQYKKELSETKNKDKREKILNDSIMDYKTNLVIAETRDNFLEIKVELLKRTEKDRPNQDSQINNLVYAINKVDIKDMKIILNKLEDNKNIAFKTLDKIRNTIVDLEKVDKKKQLNRGIENKL